MDHTELELPSPAAAVERLASRLRPPTNTTEQVRLESAHGRVLASAIRSDRPSPPFDASAMDGYALRLADLQADTLPISGEALIGQAPAPLEPGATKIMTGAPVPPGAELVVKREDVEEHADHIRLTAHAREAAVGQHIRTTGENAPADASVLAPGQPITAPVIAALSTFGVVSVPVRSRVRIRILTTGNEVVSPGITPTPWQIRNSNGPALETILTRPTNEVTERSHVEDTRDATVRAVRSALDDAGTDVLVLTGGVSMGDHDHVPHALRDAGCDVVFHRVRQRPGRPLLGAIGPNGQLVVGLPGNPLSVMVTARRILRPLLDQLAGNDRWDTTPAERVVRPDDKRLHLWWHRLVRQTEKGEIELLAGRGSGDIASAALSDGFVAIPPEQSGPGPWPYYPWD